MRNTYNAIKQLCQYYTLTPVARLTIEYYDQILVKLRQLSSVQKQGPGKEISISSEGVFVFVEGYLPTASFWMTV